MVATAAARPRAFQNLKPAEAWASMSRWGLSTLTVRLDVTRKVYGHLGVCRARIVPLGSLG
jgi:hypothetical protein